MTNDKQNQGDDLHELLDDEFGGLSTDEMARLMHEEMSGLAPGKDDGDDRESDGPEPADEPEQG